MNRKEVIPCIFYYYIHYQLKERFGEEKEVSKQEVIKYLFEWRIPTSIRPVIIKELEILNLVERINRKMIKLKKSDFTLEDIREFYKAVGIF